MLGSRSDHLTNAERQEIIRRKLSQPYGTGHSYEGVLHRGEEEIEVDGRTLRTKAKSGDKAVIDVYHRGGKEGENYRTTVEFIFSRETLLEGKIDERTFKRLAKTYRIYDLRQFGIKFMLYKPSTLPKGAIIVPNGGDTLIDETNHKVVYDLYCARDHVAEITCREEEGGIEKWNVAGMEKTYERSAHAVFAAMTEAEFIF